MFTNQARLAVLGLFALLAAFFVYQHSYELVYAVLLLIGFIVWDYFKSGAVIQAAKFYHAKDYDKAEALLHQVYKPDWLSRNRRGFYEFMLGGICLKRNDYDEAEKHYETAAQFPLRNNNDHVAALAHVANINIRKGNYDKAGTYLQLATRDEEKISSKMKEVIQKLQKELQTRKAN
ncbi:tetratricopeptide repeat protein [Mucilaginibacter sp. AW1-3]